jgi:hypothetical protein
MNKEEKIFKSFLNLDYLNNNIEKEHQINRENLIKKYLKYLTIFIGLLSVANSIQISFFFKYSFSVNFYKILCMSYLFTAVYIVFTTLVFVYSENTKFSKIINFLNYYFLVFIFINLRFPLTRFTEVNLIFFFSLLCLELIFRLVWANMGILTFKQHLILNFISIISIFSVYVPSSSDNERFKSLILMLAITFTLIVSIIFSYFLERHMKKEFYLNYNDKLKTKWFSNVLENMNTGFLSIKNGKVSYINKFLNEKFRKLKYLKSNKEMIFANSSESIKLY